MKRDFAISTAWSTVAGWIEQGAGALIFFLIARLVGVDAFGVAAMAFAFLFLGEFLVRDTITEAIVSRKDLEDGRLEATFVALTGFSLAVAGALCIIAVLAARAYGEPQVAPLLMAASPTVLMIGAAGVSTALLRRRLAYRVLAIRSVVGVIAGGIVGVSLALGGFGAWSLVGQRLTEIGINSAFAFQAAGWAPKRMPRGADFALLRGLGPRVVALRAVTLVITQTPTVALGLFAEPRAVGLFAFAWRLVELTSFVIVKPMQGVAQSAIAAMRRQHMPTTAFFLDLIELSAFGTFTAFAGLALIGEPLVGLLLGAEWREAGAILPLLCVAGATLALRAIQEAYLLALDRVDAFMTATIVEAAAGLVLIGAASPFGLGAVSASVAVRALIALPLRARAALAPEAISAAHFVKALATPMLLAAGMAIVVAGWRAFALTRLNDFWFVTSAIAIGVASAAGVLFALMPNAVARLRSFMHREG